MPLLYIILIQKEIDLVFEIVILVVMRGFVVFSYQGIDDKIRLTDSYPSKVICTQAGTVYHPDCHPEKGDGYGGRTAVSGTDGTFWTAVY